MFPMCFWCFIFCIFFNVLGGFKFLISDIFEFLVDISAKGEAQIKLI